jgi:hypothetical protein
MPQDTASGPCVVTPGRSTRATASPFLQRWGQYWLRRPFAILGIISALIVLALILITLTTRAVNADYLWPELAKASISVLTVAIVGGIIKFLLDQYVREREELKLETEFLLGCIAEIEAIRSEVEHARLLVAAYRSARTYCEQMQNIIALRVRTMELNRRIEMHWKRKVTELPSEVTDRFSEISTYLTGLMNEYQEQFKPVSDKQRIDEAVVEEQIKNYAMAVATADNQQARPELDWPAWRSLTNDKVFPRLKDFIDPSPNSAYAQGVRPHCRIIVTFLTNELTANLRLPPNRSTRLEGETSMSRFAGFVAHAHRAESNS